VIFNIGDFNIAIRSAADWALVGQALMCMPQLCELDLFGQLLVVSVVQSCHIGTAGQEMDDERFAAIGEGLAALSMLETLQLPGHTSIGLTAIKSDLIRQSFERVSSTSGGRGCESALAAGEEDGVVTCDDSIVVRAFYMSS
jgi:hypothetical protein